MAISASSPTTLSSTYDKWAFTFATSGDGCVNVGDPPSAAQPIMARVVLVKARIRSDGAWEKSPVPTDTKELTVPDLYALAATNTTVASALSALVAAVEAVGQSQGAL